MVHSILNDNKKLESQDIEPRIVENPRYWTVRGSDGDIVVDIEKAREAMRYAMEQHDAARKRERLANI